MKEPNDSFSLSITGYGMVSPLGHDVATSCATARSGITKSCELLNICFSDPETEELIPVIANTVYGLTEGFSGVGRIIQLGVGAMNDLLSNIVIDDWSRTGLILILSDGFHLIEATKISETGKDAETRIISEVGDQRELLREQVVPNILGLVARPIKLSFYQTLFGNEVSIIDALRSAADSLQNEEYERLIIGAIHSGVEAEVIEALDTLGLLKTSEQPVGILPSEMSVFLMVENENSAMKIKSYQGITLNAIQKYSESSGSFTEFPAQGRALSASINKTLCSLPDKGKKLGLVISNLNGHPYRAQNWGATLVKLKLDYPWLEELPEWYPAVNFGDAGVCSAFVAICLAIKGFERHYCGTNDILVWVASDSLAYGSFHIGYKADCK